MKGFNLSKVCNDIWRAVQRNSPEILTGLGITGMITGTVFAVKATPKAIELINKKKEEKETDHLTPVEVVQVSWKCYVPAAASTILGATCLIGSNKVSARRNAALATAYSITESAFKTYQQKVIETIGEKREQAVRDEVAKEHVHKDPVVNKEVFITGNGEMLCYDTISSRYFKCDIEKIRRVENLLNKRLISEMYISVNDFYYEIGLSPTAQGDDLGWNIGDDLIEFDFSAQLAEDGTPCLVVNYKIGPRWDYRNLH